jgi:copper chaperone CopZ
VKKGFTLLVIIALSTALAACSSGTETSAPVAKDNTVTASKLETADLKVTGMTCASCPFIVKSAIEDVKGVKKADVTLDQTTVTFDSSQVSLDQIKKAIQDVGYGVE